MLNYYLDLSLIDDNLTFYLNKSISFLQYAEHSHHLK